MKRLVIGGSTFALVSALAALAPTGATAAAPVPRSGPDRTPQRGPGQARAARGRRGRAAASADRLVHSKPARSEGRQATTAFLAGKVLSLAWASMYVPFERTYRGVCPWSVATSSSVTDSRGRVLGTSVAQTRVTSVKNVRA